MVPDISTTPCKLIIAVDNYLKESTKELERRDRRNGKEEGKRIHVTGFNQKMPVGVQKWKDFLSNGENKNDLIDTFGRYLKEEVVGKRELGEFDIIFSGRHNIWSWSRGVLKEEGSCNHEEADTKIPLFALESASNVVAVAEDCDVLVLLMNMFALKRPSYKWVIKHGGGKYADVEEMCRNIGWDNSQLLMNYHAISGCDTTSYFFRAGKLNPFRKALEKNKLYLISNLGNCVNIEQNSIESCLEFIRTVLYNGRPTETYLQTRIRLYDKEDTMLILVLNTSSDLIFVFLVG